MVQLRAKGKNITIEEQFEENICPCLGLTRKAIRPVVLNLLSERSEVTTTGRRNPREGRADGGGGQYVRSATRSRHPRKTNPRSCSRAWTRIGRGSRAQNREPVSACRSFRRILAKHGGEFKLKSKLREAHGSQSPSCRRARAAEHSGRLRNAGDPPCRAGASSPEPGRQRAGLSANQKKNGIGEETGISDERQTPRGNRDPLALRPTVEISVTRGRRRSRSPC